MVGCDVRSGVASKSLLKIRLRCKAGHASNSASAAPQNQLHLAECTCRKSCVVGCDVLREKLGLGAKPEMPKNVRHSLHASNSATPLSLRNSASAAPQNQLQLRKLHSPKNLLKNLHVALQRDAMQRNATQCIFLVS